MMKKTLLSVTLLSLLTSVTLWGGHLKGGLLFSAPMSGKSEIPAVATSGKGVATFFLSNFQDSAVINATVINLSSAITGAHIHKGTKNQNGPVVIDLGAYLNENRIEGILTGAMLSPELLRMLMKDSLYINIHTVNHPNGEVRGQLMLSADKGMISTLTGNQQVPPVPTMAMGVGVYQFREDINKLKIHVVTDSLSGPIVAAHFHKGDSGISGPPVVDLMDMIMGYSIMGEITPDANLLMDMMAGNIYINVHTTANPDGEIRGQVLMPHGLLFDAHLNGAQEAPAVTTTGQGVSKVWLNPAMDSIYYHVATTGLSGNITAAHFHKGAPGVSGPPVIDITSGVNMTHISGVITGAALTKELLNDFILGNLYLNVHTPMHPGGEIRGQVYRFAREGYTLSLQGIQEVPAVMTPANGSGYVTVDRDQTNAYYSLVVANLSAPLTGAHFHVAKAGENGPVVHHLTDAFTGNATSDTASGWWTGADGFNASQSLRFRMDSMYVNVHTTANPAGEVRGQVIRDAVRPSMVTSYTESAVLKSSFMIFPNPASADARVVFEAMSGAGGTLTISDMSGKTMSVEAIQVNSGINELPVRSTELTEGMYLISLAYGNTRINKTFIKK